MEELSSCARYYIACKAKELIIGPFIEVCWLTMEKGCY